MRTIKIGEKENNYLEFKRDNDKITIEAVDKEGRISKFVIDDEELEIVYRYIIGGDDGDSN